MIALGRVVVDDIEQHLDARIVQSLDRRTDFVDILAREVVARRREIADRTVAPIVPEATSG